MGHRFGCAFRLAKGTAHSLLDSRIPPDTRYLGFRLRIAHDCVGRYGAVWLLIRAPIVELRALPLVLLVRNGDEAPLMEVMDDARLDRCNDRSDPAAGAAV